MSIKPFQSVVVPVDFSDDSMRAIQTAVDLTEAAARVHVIHVLMPLDVVSPGALWGDVTDEKRSAEVQKHFQKLRSGGKIPEVSFEVLIGNPGLQIADFAKKVNADLIVIPSHGYHGIKRLVMGSVAERVLRHAPCDVLVLRRSDAD